MEKSSDHYIFFLKYGPKLPAWYFTMSTVFSHFNIKLLPITPGELAKMNQNMGKTQYIISFTPDMGSMKIYNLFRKKYLDFALKNNRFCLFDLSSFGKIDIAYQIEKKKVYYHFPLPVDVERFCASVTEEFLRHVNNHHDWPGGRKSKLPNANPGTH